MEYTKHFFRVTYSYQTGETCFDREQKQFECSVLDEIRHMLRIHQFNKKDFKYTIEEITITGKQITVEL